jgi:hypothetical protein
MHRLVDKASEQGLLIEANDFSAVRAMQGRPFVAGPHLNVYHADTLRWLAGLGARRFTPPIELGHEDLAAIQAQCPVGMETEVQVWGRLALAFSSRCFTARHHRLRKDSCEFRCEQYPDGLPLATRDGKDFLTINGIQTQSSTCLDLGAQVPELVSCRLIFCVCNRSRKAWRKWSQRLIARASSQCGTSRQSVSATTCPTQQWLLAGKARYAMADGGISCASLFLKVCMMDLSQFRFPAPFQQLGKWMPTPLATAPLMLALEIARRKELLVAPDTLYGKTFRIQVEDLGLSLCFTVIREVPSGL